jgi:hypothetical protein
VPIDIDPELNAIQGFAEQTNLDVDEAGGADGYWPRNFKLA